MPRSRGSRTSHDPQAMEGNAMKYFRILLIPVILVIVAFIAMLLVWEPINDRITDCEKSPPKPASMPEKEYANLLMITHTTCQSYKQTIMEIVEANKK